MGRMTERDDPTQNLGSKTGRHNITTPVGVVFVCFGFFLINHNFNRKFNDRKHCETSPLWRSIHHRTPTIYRQQHSKSFQQVLHRHSRANRESISNLNFRSSEMGFPPRFCSVILAPKSSRYQPQVLSKI